MATKDLEYLGQYHGTEAKKQAFKHAKGQAKKHGAEYVVLAPDQHDTKNTHSVVTKADYEKRGKKHNWKLAEDEIMETKFKLINTAQRRAEEIQQVAENYTQFAISIKEDPKSLMEGATQVLAGLKSLMSSGQPLTKAGLSPASLAGVVAGLRVLTRALPKMQDQAKKLKALKVLGGLSMGQNMSLGAATAIANLADKDPQHEELRAAFNQYAESGQPNAELIKLLGQLQVEVDQAMRTSQGGSQEPAPGSTPPPAVQSGGVSTVGSRGR